MKGIRPEIIHFARLMETKMKAAARRRQGGWREVSPAYAYERLMQEIGELGAALIRGYSPETIAREAADCGNFLMMLALAVKREAKEAKEISDDR